MYEDIELDDHLTCGNACSSGCSAHAAYANASIVDITYLRGSDGLTGFTVSKDGGQYERTYYYRKNIQGDITHILDNNGFVKAEYVYDAWGNHVIVKNDENAGSINPFRYHGYYYDEETNLYYLKARYYDPQTGRFINADDIGVLDATKDHINGLNLYAYCLNNPVNMADENGRIWDWIDKNIFRPIGDAVNTFGNAIVSTVSAAVNAAVGGVFNAICDIVSNNWEVVVGAAIIIGLGVATAFTGGLAGIIIAGAFYGSLSSAGIGALIGYATGGLEGAANGFMWGAIAGAALGGIGAGVGTGIKAALAGRSVLFTGPNAAKQGVVIGKSRAYEKFAEANGLAFYKGLPGHSLLKKISPKLADKLGWAHNKFYLKNVMRRGGKIHDIGGSYSGAYAKEVDLVRNYGNVVKYYLFGFV